MHAVEPLCRVLPQADTPPIRFTRGFGLAIYEATVRYLEEHRDEVLGDLALEGAAE